METHYEKNRYNDMLPNTLYELGKLALDDGRKILKRGGILPDCTNYLKFCGGVPRGACLVGAVMLNTCDITTTEDYSPANSNWDKFLIIDFLRTYQWAAASAEMVRLKLHTRNMSEGCPVNADRTAFMGRREFNAYLDNFESNLPLLKRLEDPVLPASPKTERAMETLKQAITERLLKVPQEA